MKQGQQIARMRLVQRYRPENELSAKRLPRREPPRVHYLRDEVAVEIDGEEPDAPISTEQIAAMPRDIW